MSTAIIERCSYYVSMITVCPTQNGRFLASLAFRQTALVKIKEKLSIIFKIVKIKEN